MIPANVVEIDEEVCECNSCKEIALPVEGGECRECGTPCYF